jgi:nucleoside-diphosphate-sugar epimerase
VDALDRPRLPRQTYTITGGTYLTLAQIGEIVRHVLPQADIHFGDGPDPVDDIQHQFDTSAAERDLNFRPAISLEEGIRGYAAVLRSRATA